MSPTDEQRRAAADPATDPQTLADLAAAFPELRADIAANPTAYDGLREWIAEQDAATRMSDPAQDSSAPIEPARRSASAERLDGEPSPELSVSIEPSVTVEPSVTIAPTVRFGLSRTAIIAIVAGAVLVLGGTATGVAIALSAQSPAPRPAAQTPTARPTPTSTPTPVAYPEQLDPEEWELVDGLLLQRGSQYQGDIGDTVVVHVPGSGALELTVADMFDSDAVEAGPFASVGPADDLSLVVGGARRIPAQGLTPESYDVVIATTNLRTGTTRVQTIASGLSSTTVQAVGGSAGRVAAVAYTTPNPAAYYGVDYHVVGVDVSTGDPVWDREGYGAAPTGGVIAVYGSSAQQLPGYRECHTITGVDVATGSDRWRVDALDEPRSYDGGCSRVIILHHGLGYGEYDEPSAEGIIAVAVGEGDGSTVKAFDSATGDLLAVGDVAYWHYDPIQSLLHIDDDDVAQAIVVDVHSGERVFELDNATAGSLSLRVTALYDGLMYATTTDGALAIDVDSGDVIAEGVTWYPIGEVGEWTYYSDGYLSPTPRALP